MCVCMFADVCVCLDASAGLGANKRKPVFLEAHLGVLDGVEVKRKSSETKRSRN